MRAIPPKLRKEMSEDPFYNRCCITGVSKVTAKIEWHHNLIYAGKQVNEKWCILPLASYIHDNIEKYKEKCDWIMLNRANDEELTRHSRAIDYKAMRDRLNLKYGKY